MVCNGFAAIHEGKYIVELTGIAELYEYKYSIGFDAVVYAFELDGTALKEGKICIELAAVVILQLQGMNMKLHWVM